AAPGVDGEDEAAVACGGLAVTHAPVERLDPGSPQVDAIQAIHVVLEAPRVDVHDARVQAIVADADAGLAQVAVRLVTGARAAPAVDAEGPARHHLPGDAQGVDALARGGRCGDHHAGHA